MAEELKVGCARPTGGPVGEPEPEEQPKEEHITKQNKTMIKVGKRRLILQHQLIIRVNL